MSNAKQLLQLLILGSLTLVSATVVACNTLNVPDTDPCVSPIGNVPDTDPYCPAPDSFPPDTEI